MERNTLTTLDQLQVGYRFYKFGDKKKKVMAVCKSISGPITKTLSIKICDGHFYGCEENHPATISYITKPEEKQVIFLRHQN